MMWDIGVRGFLPSENPLETLLQAGRQPNPFEARLDALMYMLPRLIDGRSVREQIYCNLRETMEGYNEEYIASSPEPIIEKYMMIFSYLASAYVYARKENPADHIPWPIARPLVKLADLCGRKPILSYASYCLNNWSLLDHAQPIQLGNIKLNANFCSEEVGKQDEDWFILVHVEIENVAAAGVAGVKGYYEGVSDPQWTLQWMKNSLDLMNQTLARMPEQCSPDNYFRWVRPYIFSFNNIVYETCFNNQPQTFRGETGAQSSIIPAFIAALGIRHRDSMLTHHLREMRDYMPPNHRQFLANLEAKFANQNLREDAIANPALRNLYNDCVQGVLDFRKKHFEYAINYIARKVENPQGTGGTPYVPWLQQLRDETEQHLLV